jgi:hypothetical protein
VNHAPHAGRARAAPRNRVRVRDAYMYARHHGPAGVAEGRGGAGIAVSDARCGAEVSGESEDDGGRVGGGNDLGGGLGEEANKGLRPGRRIVGLV